MKVFQFLFCFFVAVALWSCDGNDSQQESAETGQGVAENKGIGPVKNVTLDPQVNEKMAADGEKIYNNMCSACHKVDEDFIGPPLGGITKKRTPEWIMNMILNPGLMAVRDPAARALLEKYQSPMPDLHIPEKEARNVLEYLRTL